MGFMDRFKHAAESVQAATSHVGVGASADQMAEANKAQKLTKEGVDTPAHIDSRTATGETNAAGSVYYLFNVTIKPGAPDSYQLDITQGVHPTSNWGEEGQDVTVKVDPADPNVAMIWGAR
jgi:hypothetical protein